MIAAAAVIAWALLGLAGFVFWWTSEWDFTDHELPTFTLAALLGPLAWLAGAWIHRKRYVACNTNPFGGRVLVRCRRRP